MKWYQRKIEAVFEQLNSSPQGLTATDVQERLQRYGPNKLAGEEKISKLTIALNQFTSPLIYILLVAGLVTLLLHEYIDAGVIATVLLLNALIGYIQEVKAEESVRSLKKLVVPRAHVVRDGKERDVNSEDLVPGDVVLLASGAKVPADLRLFRTVELKVDEAMLTGESVRAEKGTTTLPQENLTPGDQTNMAFMGTVVTSGRASGLVVETGGRTILGEIAREVKELSITKTPLQQKIANFAKFIGLLVLSGASLVILIGLLKGINLSEIFITAVAASVATVPEGLPIVVTITMAIGITRMARRNAVIRKLPAVETLGSTTVICSDKTGTLTKNEMTVKLIYDGERMYEVAGSGYEPKGELTFEGRPVDAESVESLKMLLRIGLLCNESNIEEENGEYRVSGDPTEAALIVSAMKAGFDVEKERKDFEQLAMIPFESERGYMATLHRHQGKKFIFIKGAPEQAVGLCTSALCLLSDKQDVLEHAHYFAEKGMRVLAMAYKEAPDDLQQLTPQDVEGKLVFAGVQAMIDPPRQEAIEAVKECKGAGIRVVMVTGDHAVTAGAIAQMLEITGEKPQVLTGSELGTLSDEELFQQVQEISVFARVSPHQKLRIVQQLMKQGEVVAVTGDGVNDAPALKAAHIGIAMGKSGTDVARESSDMVIADDNFASIFSAVEEGRVVFDNIRKVTLFLIPTGFAALISIFITMLMGIPIPYVAAQLLWINLVTNGLQDVALAFEPGEKGIIKRPPRNPREGIMSRLMKERSMLVGLIISLGVVCNFKWALDAGQSLENARTMAVTTMVFFQFFQAWNSRSELQSILRIGLFSNPFLFYSMVAAFFAQLAVLYVPALQWVFRTVPLTPKEWLQIIVVASTIIIAVELDKWIRRKSMKAAVVAT